MPDGKWRHLRYAKFDRCSQGDLQCLQFSLESCYAPGKEGGQKEPNKADKLDTLQFVFGLMVAFPGYLFATKPTTVGAAITFRIAIFLIGVIGLVVVQILKRRK